ncbi:UvrD-helicase domain-containing protein [Spongiimicrobium sp. 2-473A-2-J]|uniref:UvrD-helicase domain-containing protein n=1 Tax=Eudoraea algarum TaxID=3417568 RepID=UPI003D36191B
MTYTDEQNRIFEFVAKGEGHGIIDAVAGAGKTTTIIEAAKYTNHPNSLLFCAFNRSIAGEINNRFVEKRLFQVTTSTIHSLGLQILKTNLSSEKEIKLKENKYQELINNSGIRKELLPRFKEILKINNLNYDEYAEKQNHEVNNLIWKIRRRLLEINQKYRLTLCKDNFTDLRNMVFHYGIFSEIEEAKRNIDTELELYFDAHQYLLTQANKFSENHYIIDYADMLYLPYKWKLQSPKKFGFLFIDECQDLSRSQLVVALKYASKGSRILSVGDPIQSIYGFSGADIESFNNIEKITNAKRLPLTTCFRCPKLVINLAQEFRSDIQGNKGYDGKVEEILIKDVVKSTEENDLIVSRTKDPILLLVFRFIEFEKKVRIHPDIAKDLIRRLRGLFQKELITRRIESFPGGFNGLKKEALDRQGWIIRKEAKRIIDNQLREIHIKEELSVLESKLEFLHKRYEIWKKECSSLEDIFKKINEYISEKENPITLSTIHTAKGLEANRVFILDFEKLPLKRPEQKEWEKIQENNLKYVAITRAKEELFLVSSEKIQEQKDEGSLFDDLFDL